MSADVFGNLVSLLVPGNELATVTPAVDYSAAAEMNSLVAGGVAHTSANPRFGRNTIAFTGATGGYIRYASSPKWTLYPEGCVELDFRLTDVTKDALMLYNGQYGSNEPWSIIWVGGATRKFLSTQSFGTAFYSDQVTLQNDTWYRIALDGLSSEYAFRLDGALIGSRNAGMSFPNQQSTLWVGGMDWGTSNRLVGQLANIRLTRKRRHETDYAPETEPFPLPDQMGMRILPASRNRKIDMVDGGNYRVTGTVTRLGVLGRYRCFLMDKQSKRVVRETFSDDQGIYTFRNVAYRPGGYIAVACDHNLTPVNAASSDQLTLTPEPTPS